MHSHSSEKRAEHPLLILYTGDGKGKTSAAMGLVFRACGHDGSCAVLQFIKHEHLETGERSMARRLGIPWENHGTGFLWDQKKTEEARIACVEGWMRAQAWITSHDYDLIVLDEFTYPLSYGFIPLEEVIGFFTHLREDPLRPHVVITGRNAPEPLVKVCDMVHSIMEVKHPWRSAHVKAQQMIEY